MTRLFVPSVLALALGLAAPAWAQTTEELNQQELARITSAVPAPAPIYPPPAPAPTYPPPAAYPAPAYNPYAYCYDPYGSWTGYCGYQRPYSGFYGGVGVGLFGGHRFFHHGHFGGHRFFHHGHRGHFGGHGGHGGGHGGGRHHR